MYEFKRDFYDDIINNLSQNHVLFVLGPRKCGKTVCLLQLDKELNNSRYIDFKNSKNADESFNIFNDILTSIKNNEEKVYLLDEVSYVEKIDSEIENIALAFSEYENINTKIIFTSSQALSLRTWARRAFGGNAEMINTSFLTYREWLRYKKIDEPSKENYQEFLLHVNEFYGFKSLEEYLSSCLEETIISNSKADNYIFGNECFLIENDKSILIDICYATLFSLHNHISYNNFIDMTKLEKDIPFYFRELCSRFDKKEIGERIANSFIGRYRSFHTKDLDALKQGLLFLYHCGLITITPVVETFDKVPDIYADLRSDESRINYKTQLFANYNVCIKYPMFYVQIIKDILGDLLDEGKELPGTLLGSIVECHARGLLPDDNCFEYRNIEKQEIDYVNVIKQTAIEFTISDKHKRNFDILPEGYKNIMLTKNIKEKWQNNEKIPYYDFIYMLSKKNYDFFINNTNGEKIKL